MAGTYFDFSNTPINSDITLKAKWCCASQEEPYPEGWDGDGAMRVTLTNGKVLTTNDNAVANKMLAGNMTYSNGMNAQIGDQNIVGFMLEGTNTPMTITAAQVKKLDFGKGYITGQGFTSVLTKYSFTSLTTMTGFQSGTTTLPLFMTSGLPPLLTGVVLNVPESVTNIENFLIKMNYKMFSKIICNGPPPTITNTADAKRFLAHSKNEYGALAAGTYLNVTGPYADDWMAAYPNDESDEWYIRRLEKV